MSPEKGIHHLNTNGKVWWQRHICKPRMSFVFSFLPTPMPCSHMYQVPGLPSWLTRRGEEWGTLPARFERYEKSLIRREPTCQHFRAILALLLGFLWKLTLMWPRIQGVFFGSSKGWYSQSLAKWRAWTHQLWLSWGSLFKTSHWKDFHEEQVSDGIRTDRTTSQARYGNNLCSDILCLF